LPDTLTLALIDRRRFLHLIGGVAAASLSAACAADASMQSGALTRPELANALGAERVRDLGRRYRELVASERSADALREAIVRSLPWRARIQGSTASDLAQLVHDDFGAGRTVVVSGWILSLTEARQCALFSLLPA
jgi:hypothetical protein